MDSDNNKFSDSIGGCKFLDQLKDYKLLKNKTAPYRGFLKKSPFKQEIRRYEMPRFLESLSFWTSSTVQYF
jgi:hypothetical protein